MIWLSLGCSLSGLIISYKNINIGLVLALIGVIIAMKSVQKELLKDKDNDSM